MRTVAAYLENCQALQALRSEIEKLLREKDVTKTLQRRIQRLFVAKHKQTGECRVRFFRFFLRLMALFLKGYAYVGFELLSDANFIQQRMNNHKFEYSILSVERSKRA